MKSIKIWCDVILLLGIVLIFLGWYISHSIVISNGQYDPQLAIVRAVHRTVKIWALECTGFSFVILSRIFKSFVKKVEKELNEIKEVQKTKTEDITLHH